MKHLFKIALILFLSIPILAQGRKLREETFTVNKGELLEVDVSSGNIKVRTWDKDEVEVKIYGNRKVEKKFDISIDKTSRGIKVRVKKEGWSFFNWSDYNLSVEVKIPEVFDTEIETSGGDIVIFDVNGTNEISTSGGDILVENCKGKLRSSTSGGSIDIVNHTGETMLNTSGGDITVKRSNGRVDAETSGGDINLTANNGEVYASTSGGDITLYYDGSNEGIKLSTTGGSIRVRLPEDVRADVKLSTTGGDAELETANTDYDKIKSYEIIATINGGGKIINCYTTGGDITVSN